MSRELKFRVWSNIKNCWLNSICIGNDGSPFLHYVHIDDKQNVIHKVFTIESLQPIIQQSTGLKDTTGKEIYDGDICYYFAEHESLSEYGRRTCKGKIGWYDNFCWTFNYDKKIESSVWFLNSDFDFTKLLIIGNICENPELI